jgi:hypothetical protein
MLCNCEYSHCDHTTGLTREAQYPYRRCERPVVVLVGALCDVCASVLDAELLIRGRWSKDGAK